MSAYSSAPAVPPGRGGASGRLTPVARTTAGHTAAQRPARGRPEASRLPLIVGAAATLLSLILAIMVLALASAPAQLFAGLSLPLVSSGGWVFSLVGYLLTPLVVILAYGWDVAWQRHARAENRNVVLRPGSTRILKWLMVSGIVLGAWHVLNLAVPLTEAWGLG